LYGEYQSNMSTQEVAEEQREKYEDVRIDFVSHESEYESSQLPKSNDFWPQVSRYSDLEVKWWATNDTSIMLNIYE
jgi:hypothetical protein